MTSATQLPDDHLLTLPPAAGRAIVEAGAVLARPLLDTKRFIKLCKQCSLPINRDRLFRLERLGVFAPVFRVGRPDDGAPFRLPPESGHENWFDKGLAWDTTAVPARHLVPDASDRSHEAYYSVFQLDWLYLALGSFTFSVQIDGFVDHPEGGPGAWDKLIDSSQRTAAFLLASMQADEHRRSVALLCQYISNRYYPLTQTDRRTIQLRTATRSDRWTFVDGSRWSWDSEVSTWDPARVEAIFALTPRKLEQAYRTLALAQSTCDPLERWYQLVQFISVRERERLKGDAKLADVLRAGAHMLRLLHQDLYASDLPHPNELTGTIITHVPELAVRDDPRRHLEFVVNRFGLNPQPKLVLILEGHSEEIAVLRVFREYFGFHPGVCGIEIVVLGGVDAATGSKKEDRFRAILRLVDYLHHHQTIAFLILDNENYATRLKKEAKTMTSIHSTQRYATRADYVSIWRTSFEFDNFSCTEIAAAVNDLAGSAIVNAADVAVCKAGTHPGKQLSDLYRDRAGHGIRKLQLAELLSDRILSPDARRRPDRRPIVKLLRRVARLASTNPLPVMLESWERNQASAHLGKRRRSSKKT